MGLLDDAIREHLDLKRRRGADPADVERDEREALGPVRRNQAPAAAEVEDDAGSEQGFAYDQADEDDWAFDEGSERPAPESSSEASTVAPPDYGTADLDDDLEPFADEPAPDAEDRPVDDDALSGATVEYDVASDLQRDLQRESEPAAAADPAAPAEPGELDDDDVLEETPEFLQDTPDHDRLWFEQRPPRDFDFDG